jgi:hypothetical protein
MTHLLRQRMSLEESLTFSMHIENQWVRILNNVPSRSRISQEFDVPLYQRPAARKFNVSGVSREPYKAGG